MPRETRLLVAIALAYLAIHWLNQALATYGLMFDEAQYWFWAKHPAWGYYSKPPIIAWLIAASTSMFGDGNFGVKMLAPVLLLATGFMLYATARKLDYSPRIATWVLVTYLTLPVVTGNSMFFTTDVPLQFCWAGAMYAVIVALRQDRPRYWLLAGLAVGLGLLSKYTMVGFAASSFIALLLTPAARRQLRSPWPWMGGLLAATILVPNLIWNAHHHFVTLHHTDDNVFSKSIEIYPSDMVEFMGVQFGVFGPILLASLLLSLRSIRRDGTALLHCFVWPLAAAGILVSLIAGAQAHWIAPCYQAATLIVVPWLAGRRPAWLRISLVLHVLVLLLFYAAPAIIPQLHLKRDPFARVLGWDALAQQLRPTIAQHPEAVLMTNERKIAAAFTYRLRDLRGMAEPVYKWKEPGVVRDHYDLVTDTQDFSHKPLLVVLRDNAADAPKPSSHAKLLQRMTMDKYFISVYLMPPGSMPR